MQGEKKEVLPRRPSQPPPAQQGRRVVPGLVQLEPEEFPCTSAAHVVGAMHSYPKPYKTERSWGGCRGACGVGLEHLAPAAAAGLAVGLEARLVQHLPTPQHCSSWLHGCVALLILSACTASGCQSEAACESCTCCCILPSEAQAGGVAFLGWGCGAPCPSCFPAMHACL